MSFLIVLASLCFLMFIAYRGYSVILFAPVAALGAVLFTDPTLVAPCSPASSWTRWSAS
jgi:H+/gluconate symporter-like permease